MGNARLLAENGIEELGSLPVTRLEEQGKTAALVALGGRLLGILGISDSPREDSRQAIEALSKMGVQAIMLTGDNERSARAVSEQCGISEYHARLLPEDKERKIREFSARGRCAMVGDGINDAPALAAADVGIAVGAGTEVAIDCAQVVLSSNSLCSVATAVSLSRATMLTIKENLFWALLYNSICIPVAAGVLAGVGIMLSPMLASAAMSFSSVCVVLNSIRLRRRKIFENKTQKTSDIQENSISEKENDDMFGKKKTVTFGVEGMMCNNCKAHVEKAILSVKGVKSVETDLETKTVIVVAKDSIDESTLKSAVTAAGYKVN